MLKDFFRKRGQPRRSPSPPPLPPPTQSRNIILFGGSGVGKSSVVNMLLPDTHQKTAQVDAGAKGCTFEAESFPTEINGSPYMLWDTAGLNEGEGGTVPTARAIIQLYDLLVRLTKEGGVSLLVFVIRGPRLVESVSHNWKLFYDVIYQTKVPAVVVITGLENDGLDSWLEVKNGANKAVLDKYGIKPDGFACITATKGLKLKGVGYVYEELYRDSQSRLRDLVNEKCRKEPWCIPPVQWFTKIIDRSYETKSFLCVKVKEVRSEREIMVTEVKGQLKSQCGLSEEDLLALEKMAAKFK